MSSFPRPAAVRYTMNLEARWVAPGVAPTLPARVSHLYETLKADTPIHPGAEALFTEEQVDALWNAAYDMGFARGSKPAPLLQAPAAEPSLLDFVPGGIDGEGWI